MTTIVYNDIVLRDCETLAFDQDVQYDESNTDIIYSKFRIRVASTVVAIRNVTTEDQFGVDTLHGTTVVQRQHDIQRKLWEPRKDFWFLIDNCVQDERQGDGNFDAPTLDQPLLIAAGEAWSESIETYTTTINGSTEVAERVVRTELNMDPHPFSTDSTTRLYGDGSVQISKASVLDCENGPKPKHVSVVKIIGGRSLRVEFEIVVCRKICSEEFSDSEPVVHGGEIVPDSRILSNRWHLDEKKDENWVTTRSLQGTLRVSNSAYWPQAMRYLCVPGLLRGYKRMNQSFVDDPTGLVLKYRIDDKQVHESPPYPAVSWSGHHAETATGSYGVIKGGELQVRLTGPPGVDKQQLIGAAVKVAANKITGLIPERDSSGDFDFSTILNNAAIVDVLGEPTIELRVQVRFLDNSFNALALRMLQMGDPLPSTGDYAIDGYDPKVNPVPLAYDSDNPAGVFNCYLQHPCSIWHGMPTGHLPGSAGFDYDEDESDSESVDPVDRPENLNANNPDAVVYSEDHTISEDDTDIKDDSSIYTHPYSFVELQNRYEIDEGWAALPIADTSAGATKNSLLVQLHGAVSTRVLTMTATRNGRPAVIPAMTKELTDPNGNREVLAKRIITAKAPQLLANGAGREYETEIQFVYLLEKTPPDDGKLRTGSSPLDAFSPDSNWIDLATTVDGSGQLQYDDNTTTYPV